MSASAATIKTTAFVKNTQTAQQNPWNLNNDGWNLVTRDVKYELHPEGSL